MQWYILSIRIKTGFRTECVSKNTVKFCNLHFFKRLTLCISEMAICDSVKVSVISEMMFSGVREVLAFVMHIFKQLGFTSPFIISQIVYTHTDFALETPLGRL